MNHINIQQKCRETVRRQQIWNVRNLSNSAYVKEKLAQTFKWWPLTAILVYSGNNDRDSETIAAIESEEFAYMRPLFWFIPLTASFWQLVFIGYGLLQVSGYKSCPCGVEVVNRLRIWTSFTIHIYWRTTSSGVKFYCAPTQKKIITVPLLFIIIT